MPSELGDYETRHTLRRPLHRLVDQVTQEHSTSISLQDHVRIKVLHRAPALPPAARASARAT